jgi:hypothetical protein
MVVEEVFAAFVDPLVTCLFTSVAAIGFGWKKASKTAIQGEARQNNDEA